MRKALFVGLFLAIASSAFGAGSCTAGAIAAAAAVPKLPVTLSGNNCWYAANSGSDTNNGTSEATPFAHAPGMKNCTNNCASAAVGANTGIILRGGDTWPHASFMWDIPGGTSGNPSYIGVDKSWFTGGSWTKPVMDSGGTLIANNNGTMFTLGPNTVVDNFEDKGFFWDGTNIGGFGQITMWNWGQQSNQEVSNQYIHGWTHPGTDHTATAGIACIFCTGGGGNSSADNNVIDGSDVAGDHSVNAFFDGPPQGAFNVIKQVSSAFIVSFDTAYHDNRIDDVGPSYCNTPFPAFAGACSHENAFEDNADTGLTFCNNVVSHVHAGLALWVAPYPGSTVKVCNNVIWGIDDNQVVDIAPPVYVSANCQLAWQSTHSYANLERIIPTVNNAAQNYFDSAGGTSSGSQPNWGVSCSSTCSDGTVTWTNRGSAATGNNYCQISGSYIFDNNTIQCGNDSTRYDVCQTSIGAVGSGSKAQSVTSQNNHYIAATTAANSCTAVGSGGPLSCTLANNIIQTQSTANGQGYTSSQIFAFSPTISSNSTVGAGANLSGSWPAGISTNDTTYGCTQSGANVVCPAHTTIARPSVWDTGAYQFNSLSPVVTLTPSVVSFSRQLVMTTSSGLSVTLSNTGGAILNITTIALTTGTQYAITANTCGSTLAASFSCSITIKFTPTTLGAKTDSLVFTTNAATSPDTVAVSGGGIPATQVFDFQVPLSTELCTNSNTATNITTPDFQINFNYNSVRYWVKPNPTNGHFYKVTTAGTSGGSQPSFNTGGGSTTTSGGVTFTEQGSTNAGECRDEFFLYVLPHIDGAVLGFNAFDLDPSNGGGTAQASGGYTYSALDTTVNSFVTATEWGVQDAVVMLLRPGTYHTPNTWTPTYWMNATYAATLGAPANNACYCSGYPGDKTAGTNACFNDGDTTGVPVAFDVPFNTAYNLLLASYTGHLKAASYHSSIAYARHGGTIGGEVFPFCASAMKAKYGYTTAQYKTAWTGAIKSNADELVAATPNYPIEGAMNGLCVPAVGCVVGYDWADAEAVIYTNDGMGIANQGLTQADIAAFANNGFASGGTASVSGTYCSNDFCYNFHTFPAANPSSLQMGTVSNPTGAGTGSLVDIAAFVQQQQATALEIYNQDLMIAYDPNYPQYSTYHTAYALSILNLRTNVPIAASQPNGLFGAATAGGSVTLMK